MIQLISLTVHDTNKRTGLSTAHQMSRLLNQIQLSSNSIYCLFWKQQTKLVFVFGCVAQSSAVIDHELLEHQFSVSKLGTSKPMYYICYIIFTYFHQTFSCSPSNSLASGQAAIRRRRRQQEQQEVLGSYVCRAANLRG